MKHLATTMKCFITDRAQDGAVRERERDREREAKDP